jgi:choline dehydrogenase-like flavoprotein
MPISEIQEHYEVVVIGSGYGGGISASRMARAGRKVCLLERGREIQPGEYPNTLVEATEEFQVHGADGHVGSRIGLFDLHVNAQQNVIVGCGLGGTSLINANVSLEAKYSMTHVGRPACAVTAMRCKRATIAPAKCSSPIPIRIVRRLCPSWWHIKNRPTSCSRARSSTSRRSM